MQMMKNISPEAEHPYRHIKEANELIVEAASLDIPTDELAERLYFITEGWAEKDHRSAGERFREIMRCT